MIHPGFNPEEYVGNTPGRGRPLLPRVTCACGDTIIAGRETVHLNSLRHRHWQQPEKTKRPKKSLQQCSECGATIWAVGDPATTGWHTKGVFHKQSGRIRALLAENCLTFTEIGSRLGVTRERVRQIAKILETAPGVERMKTCTLNRHKSIQGNRLPDTDPALIERFLKLRTGGYEVEASFVDHRNPNGHIAVTINGHSCRISITKATAAKMSPRAKVLHYRFQDPRLKCEFLILYIAKEDAAYIVPRSWLPATIYIAKCGTRSYEGYKNQRDYEQFRENFEQLKPAVGGEG